jgi:hypothetical protein
MAAVARKISVTEERRKEEDCLFRHGGYKNQGHKPENFPGSRLGKDVGFMDNSNNNNNVINNFLRY